LGVYAVGRISGAHLNPAVTIGLWAAGDFEAELMAGYILAQLAGAFTGAVLVWLHFHPHWRSTNSEAVKLGVFCTAPAVRHSVSNLISEIIATTVLITGLLF